MCIKRFDVRQYWMGYVNKSWTESRYLIRKLCLDVLLVDRRTWQLNQNISKLIWWFFFYIVSWDEGYHIVTVSKFDSYTQKTNGVDCWFLLLLWTFSECRQNLRCLRDHFSMYFHFKFNRFSTWVWASNNFNIIQIFKWNIF